MREPKYTLRASDPLAEEALRYLASMRARECRRVGDRAQKHAKATLALAEQFSQWRKLRRQPLLARFFGWRQ